MNAYSETSHMRPAWTMADRLAAAREGWDIFWADHADYAAWQVEAVDDYAITDDLSAILAVMSPEPSELHERARAFLRAHDPDELRRMVADVWEYVAEPDQNETP